MQNFIRYLLPSIQLIMFVNLSKAQDIKLVQLWETDPILKVPESVLYHPQKNILYVSNIQGTPWGKDGKGYIAKIDTTGKIIDSSSVSGLDCPKGMVLNNQYLYVADLDRLVVINTDRDSIIQQIAIPGSMALNDIAIDSEGVLYVSDSKAKRVYKVENSHPSVFLDSLEGPNGILFYEQNLYLLDNGALYKVYPDGSKRMIANGMKGGTDGLVSVGEDEFIVSCWSGIIYFIDKNGNKQVLIDLREQKLNTADITFDQNTQILYVPTFYGNKLMAYKLER